MAITNENHDKKKSVFRVAGKSLVLIFVLGLAAYAIMKTFTGKEAEDDEECSCPEDCMEECCAEKNAG